MKFCPFCGCKAVVVLQVTDAPEFAARCCGCATQGPPRRTKQDAKQAWHTRYFLPATDTDFRPFAKE